MAPKPSSPATRLVYAGTAELWMHTGGGQYAHITPGCGVPDGVDPSNLGPDWVPSTQPAVSTASPTTEEV